MPPSATRKYQSSKRNRPCDRCRETKTRCRVLSGSQCVKCQRESVDCSFSGPISSRPIPRSDVQRSDGFRTPTATDSVAGHDLSNSLVGQWMQNQSPSVPAAFSHVEQPNDRPLSIQPTSFAQHPELDIKLNTQFSQSLEGLQGYSAQLFGSSSESDPWLLRHCRFDDFGTRSFQNAQFRNAGGVPFNGKIPIHFMIEANDLHESAKDETRIFDTQIATREELNQVVPPECGQRLVALFCKHVFPMLPVISRSQLGISSATPLPSWDKLDQCPLHLLAAIYALALRFVSDDEHLAIWHAQAGPPTEVLWRLVYERLQEAIHLPQLSVVQATILYLHKEPSDDRRYALSETPFTWAWTGKLVGLTTSLGIHTECSMWAIPSWEKRLRKRLWWAVFAEDKWRSLLMGRPPYLNSTEWDVEDLESVHFGATVADTLDEQHVPFRSFMGLTHIAASIQETFYSLRASQRLSTDLNASVDAAKPLLERLNLWRSSLAEYGPQDHVFGSSAGPRSSIHFAYHILVIYVYRALFRPIVPSSVPPHIIDLEEPVDNSSLNFEEFNWDAPPLANMTFPTPPTLESNPTDYQAEIVEEITRAATKCAIGMINLTRRFSFGDFSSFWHSWSRIGFAVTSNFIVLLVVQAPNAQYAAKGKQLLDVWSQTLKDQCQMCPMVRLGMMRLTALMWAGLSQTFDLPPHVEQALIARQPPGSWEPIT